MSAWYSSTLPIADRKAYDAWARNGDPTARADDERQRDRDLAANATQRAPSQSRNYIENPTRISCSPFWADLFATLDAFGLTHLLEERLAQPLLGHPMYADARRRSRLRSLESEAAVLRADLAAWACS